MCDATRSGLRSGSLGVVIESENRGHTSVDLLQGWSTDTLVSSSCTTEQGGIQVKRSQSQETSELSAQCTGPQFKTIGFPKKASSLAVSLYTGLREDEVNDEDRLAHVPPSKRPGVSHAKKTPPDHIKRPRNAYIIFRSHTVSQKLIPKEVEKDHRNISRIVAHMWKSLAPEERALYEQIAKEEKERHKQLHPDYRYQPTLRRTGVNRRNVKKLENGEEECQEIADIILKAQGKEGLVVQSKPSKGMKRAREATRPRLTREKKSVPEPSRKRAKTVKPTVVEDSASEQVLETVFLRPSSSQSPTSASGNEFGTARADSPDAFRLASRTPSVDQGQGQAPEELSPGLGTLLDRRASSAPLSRPCSPPPPFALSSQGAFELEQNENAVVLPDDTSSSAVSVQIDFSDESLMPAPAWKGRRSLPSPIQNTWQHCSFDGQAFPSPRSFDAVGAASKLSMARPRTALPSTPSSGSFRGFFHPWAYENGNETMLVSPMTASFQDLRRRSSLGRSSLVAGRRLGSFGMDPSQDAGDSVEATDASQILMSNSDANQLPDVQLFEQAARAAAMSLAAESPGAALHDSTVFAFDPALEGEGCETAAASSLQVQGTHCGLHSAQSPHTAPHSTASSPRPSFSGSTLAAAARDWASITRHRSKFEQITAQETDSQSSSTASTADGAEARSDTVQQEADKMTQARPSLQELVERAVLLAFNKDSGNGADRGERHSRIVQQILSSLNAELSLQSAASYSIGVEQVPQAVNEKKACSPLVEHSRRPSARGVCGLSSSFKSGSLFPVNTAAEAHRGSKPLPSPLQLVMSNHEAASEPYSHTYLSSQHCN